GRVLDEAVAQVFGVRPAEMAANILERWDFPPSYSSYFRNPAPDAGARVYDSVAKLAAVVSLADEYTSDAGATDAVTQRFQAHFNLAPEQCVAATETAEETLREQAPMLGIVLPKPARHVSATKQPGGGGATTVVEANAGATEAPSPLAIITEITQ